MGNVHDVITCAEFQIEIFMGYDFTGVEFSIFLLILALQQCSATALPVVMVVRTRAVTGLLYCHECITKSSAVAEAPLDALYR